MHATSRPDEAPPLVGALAAAILTFGLLFLPAVLLVVLAAANLYAALRIGGLALMVVAVMVAGSARLLVSRR